MPTLQLASLFLALATALSFVKSARVAAICAFLASPIFVVQASSVILLGQVADDKFYIHLAHPSELLKVTGAFTGPALVILAVLAVVTPLLYWSSRALRRFVASRVARVAALALAVLAMLAPGGILRELSKAGILQSVERVPFGRALASLGIPEAEYTVKDEVRAEKGKNIIILSLESIERSYLEAPLAHLTPNMRALRERHSYFEMEASPGGGYTIASLYMLLTGMPAFVGRFGVADFSQTRGCRLVGFPDALRAAGYDMRYFAGNTEFMGKDKLMRNFGFSVQSPDDFAQQYERSAWGVHDKDLFAEIGKTVTAFARDPSKQPFCIVASTLSTHFPDGIFDARMKGAVPEQQSELAFMVAALDHHIGQLVELLRETGLYEKTALILTPDHLFMGNKGLADFEDAERGLFVITNTEPGDFTFRRGQRLTQADLPRCVLEAAGVRHNAKFFADFLPRDAQDAVRANELFERRREDIARLNLAALDQPELVTVERGLSIQAGPDRSIEVSDARGTRVASFAEPARPDFQHLEFGADFALLSSTPKKDPQLLLTPLAPGVALDLVVAKRGDALYACLRRGPFLRTTKKGRRVDFGPEELELLDEWQFAPLGQSKASFARFPCGLPESADCGMRVTTIGGDSSIGNKDFGLRLERAPSPERSVHLACLLLCGGERHTTGVELAMPCGESLLVYPRLDRTCVVLPVPVQTAEGDACSARAIMPLALPNDPKFRGETLTAQWIVASVRPAEHTNWRLAFSRAVEFTIR